MKKNWLIAEKIAFSLSLIFAFANAGQVDKNATTINLEPIIVSANLTETNSLKYAGSVGVIREKQLKSKQNVIDAMMDIPGVMGGNNFGRQIGKNFSIRGFSTEERLLIKQDGIGRTHQIYSGMISSLRTDSDLLKRVEVVKGASSILHGSGAIGGVISMETKQASDFLRDGKNFGVMLGSRIESNNMHSIRGAVYGKFDEVGADFLAYAKRAEFGNTKFADGGRISDGVWYKKGENDETIDTLFFKAGANLGDSHRVQFSIYDFDEDLRTSWQTIRGQQEGNPLKGNLTQRDYVFDYFYNPVNLDFVNLSFKAYKSDAKYYRFYVPGNVQNMDLSYSNQDERYGGAIKNEAVFQTGFIDHNLVFGFDYQNRKEDAIYILSGVKSDFGGMPNTQKTYAAYLQDIMQMGDFELTLGGRYDKFKSTAKFANQNNSRFSPRIAMGWNVMDSDFTLLAGYSESFRAPTPSESSQYGPTNRMYYYVPNPDLKPETAKEFEFGFSTFKNGVISDDDYFSVKAVWFDGKIDNMITVKARDDLGTPPPNHLNDFGASTRQKFGQYQNVDKARRYGTEISAKYAISDFAFDLGYEWLKIYDDETKEDLTQYASRVMGKIEYSPLPNLNLGLKINHWFKPHSNPSFYVSGGDTYYYVDKSFTIADFSGSYEIKHGIIPFLDNAKINFGVNNIFNRPYIPATQTTDSIYVGTGRNFYVDFEVKF